MPYKPNKPSRNLIKMVSLILGGGAGTRLYPLTLNRSKPAVPIGGKYRLIDIPISNCLNSGVRRMFVLTQYNSASLNQHIKNTYNFDLFGHGFVDILAAEQTPNSKEWFQGTADAVRQTMHHLDNHEADYVLILSGDQLYQMDFEDMVDAHIAKGADISIATIPVNSDDATSFGIMKVEGGLIPRFIEKPSAELLPDWRSEVSESFEKRGKVYLASMGIYIFNKKALEKLFDDNHDAVDFGKEILPKAIESGYKVASYEFDGYWTDIGNISSFFEANIDLASEWPAFNFFDNSDIIYTRPRLLAPSKLFGTQFHHAIMAEGCIVHASKIERSVIGIRSRIGDNTVILQSIIMGNDSYEHVAQIKEATAERPAMGIGKNCFVERAIVDKDVRIGDNVYIRGHSSLAETETDQYCVRDGIIVVKKGAVIPNGAVIGLGSSEATDNA